MDEYIFKPKQEFCEWGYGSGMKLRAISSEGKIVDVVEDLNKREKEKPKDATQER